MGFNNRNQKLRFLSLIISMSLISSCAPVPRGSTQPVITSVVTSSPSPAASNPSVPSPTIEVVSTSTVQPASKVSLAKECIPTEDKMPEGLVLSGVWIRSQGQPYLENLDEHTKYEVPLRGGSIFDTYSAYMSISPDGKHLAYIDPYLDSSFRTQKLILRIINSSGHSVSMDYWKVSWQWIIGWIDNQNLALSVSNSISNNDVIILNPFTGKWKRFEPPPWLKLDDSHYWSLPYSPTLESYWDPENQHLVLKDTKTGNTIWQTDQGGGLTWSRDGSKVVVNSASFIDIVSKNEPAVEFDIRELRMESWHSLTLSPNGEKMFFSAYYPEKFFVFDTQKSTVYGLCQNEYEVAYTSRPFWSPDNRFVVLGVYDSKYYYCYCDAYKPFDLLIDTQQMRAYKLPTRQYHERLAWLATP